MPSLITLHYSRCVWRYPRTNPRTHHKCSKIPTHWIALYLHRHRLLTLRRTCSQTRLRACSRRPVAGLTALRALRLGGMLLGRSVLVTGASAVWVISPSNSPRARAPRSPAFRAIQSAVSRYYKQATSRFERHRHPSRCLRSDPRVGWWRVADGSPAAGRARWDSCYVWQLIRSGELGRLPAIRRAGAARLYAFFVYESGERPTFGQDLGVMAQEIGAGRLHPQIGLEASWRDPLGALTALRERAIKGKAVLFVD